MQIVLVDGESGLVLYNLTRFAEHRKTELAASTEYKFATPVNRSKRALSSWPAMRRRQMSYEL